METIKVIDLLVKITNGEIKDKTKFRIHWGDMYRDFYYDGSEENQSQCLKNCSDDYSLYDDIKLNEEVEIIEDTPKENKKIKKIDKKEARDEIFTYDTTGSNLYFLSLYVQHNIVGKLNEIIDKINGE